MQHKLSICASIEHGNIDYFLLLINSIRKHAITKHEIIVHDNKQNEEIRDWSEKNDIIYLTSKQNMTFCGGLNLAARKASHKHICFTDPLMYFLPEWEKGLENQIEHYKKYKVQDYIISLNHLYVKMGNRKQTDNDFIETFDEESLLLKFNTRKKRYLSRGNLRQVNMPFIMPQKMLKKIGFIQPDYVSSVGLIEDTTSRAYVFAGCQHVISLGDSRVQNLGALPSYADIGYDKDLYMNNWRHTFLKIRNKLRFNKAYMELI